MSNPATPFVVAPSVDPAPAILCPDWTTVKLETAGLVFAAISLLINIKSPGSRVNVKNDPATVTA